MLDAAESGNYKAIGAVYAMYLVGIGCEKNLKEATLWREKILNIINSKHYDGSSFEDIERGYSSIYIAPQGEGYFEIVNALVKSSTINSASILADAFKRSGDEKGVESAYIEGAKNGGSSAKFNLANYYAKKGDTQNAQKYFQIGYENFKNERWSNAYMTLEKLLSFYYNDSPQIRPLALKVALENDKYISMLELAAQYYEDGIGTDKNPEMAFEVRKKSANFV